MMAIREKNANERVEVKRLCGEEERLRTEAGQHLSRQRSRRGNGIYLTNEVGISAHFGSAFATAEQRGHPANNKMHLS
jgi:hypothetical protein